MRQSGPLALVILDGFGYAPADSYNAISQASTPTYHYFLNTYPHTLLHASGTVVGLLDGQIGNSEAGHMTIGAGRIIQQDITRITHEIDNGSFFQQETLKKILTYAKKTGRIHLIGLVSDGSVHSHIIHLVALIRAAVKTDITEIFIHAILDGRDTPPQSAYQFLAEIEHVREQHKNIFIATVCGRFYAMDRDQNWDRTQTCYENLINKQKISFKNWQEVLKHFYAQHITDEFIPPVQLLHQGVIEDDDAVIFFNVRPERMRQLVQCFSNTNFDAFKNKKFNHLELITMVGYEHSHVPALYQSVKVENTIKEILSAQKKTIFTIAETEKYAHVTYFFDGQREMIFPGEIRTLIPSIITKTYKDYPRMSADKITQATRASLEHNICDFYLINYANADMVGHSGDLQATIKAVACLDEQLKILYEFIVKKYHGTLFITGDHGKAEDMYDEAVKQPRTAHTYNVVPFIMVNKEKNIDLQKTKSLAHIAAHILNYFDIKRPKEMI